MSKGVMLIVAGIVIFAVILQVGGCVECEKSGGVYAKTIYGTFECLRRN